MIKQTGMGHQCVHGIWEILRHLGSMDLQVSEGQVIGNMNRSDHLNRTRSVIQKSKCTQLKEMINLVVLESVGFIKLTPIIRPDASRGK